tara:strand:- start:1014 stop:1301 length:288 start_codon:yes stop_codon:yes gene_type:complete
MMENNFQVGSIVAGVLSAIILLVMGVSIYIAGYVMFGVFFLGLSLEDEMKAGKDHEWIGKLTQEKEDYGNLPDNAPENMDLDVGVLWKKLNSFRD